MSNPPNTLKTGEFSQHRLVTGAPVAADAAPGAAFPDRRTLCNAGGFDTIMAHVVLAGGVAPTVDLQPLIYDPEADTFGRHVKTGALSSGDVVEVAVYGGRAFLRIDAVVGNPTSVEIRIAGGMRSNKVV